jgi:hypothetical protein
MLDNENGITFTLPTSIKVLLPNGQVEEMKLETYLAGAVAAEIGMDAPLEALKAQAVASRTYVASIQRHTDHGADVCTTPHCQKWKHVDPVTASEIFRALSETWGMVAVHEGKLINAFFFEHCDGHTRNAEEMHIPSISYLSGVDCSCGFLSLKGHGVGMCKRGAIVMARRGASFEQILHHYYRGVAVIRTMLDNLGAEASEQIGGKLEEQPPEASRTRVRVRKAKASTEESKPAKSRREPVEPRGQPQPASGERTVPAPRHELPHVSVPVVLKRIQRVLREPVRHTKIEPPVQRVELEEDEQAPILPHPDREETVQADIEPATIDHIPHAPVAEKQVVEIPSTPVEPIAPKVVDENDLPALEEIHIGNTRHVQIDHLPGELMIAGCLAQPGITIAIRDPDGNSRVVYSGTAPHYGEGGFETMVNRDGAYLVAIGELALEVHLQGETVFIHAT